MTIDIELTNRCNARCTFCPRDSMPRQGMIAPRTFARALARAVQFRALARRLVPADEPRIVFCGTGEPLLHRLRTEFVRRVTRAGFASTISTNGALLDERTARSLLDAGLRTVVVNASEFGDEYERVYGLPFARTRDNVARFAAMAEGQCELYVAVVDHASDRERVRYVMRYWRQLGVTRFIRYELVNRAGSLVVDGMDFEAMSERAEAESLLAARGIHPVCAAPFVHLFIGFDGRYYLCSSDWQKEAPLGSVFDTSFAAIVKEKLERVRTRRPICRRCAIDPVNRLASRLRARRGVEGGPGVDALIEQIAATDRHARSHAGQVSAMVARRIRPSAIGAPPVAYPPGKILGSTFSTPIRER